MKKIEVLFLFLFVITTEVVYSQVNTQFFSQDREVFTRHPELTVTDKEPINEIIMPSFDVNALFEEDKKNKDKPAPFRFGKEFDVSLCIKDGT